LGEVADFFGDDGEAHAGLAGAGGFDGGVEGEDVGLETRFRRWSSGSS
jgi:hypothetical protein